MKIRAAVLRRFNKPLEMEESEISPLKEGEILIEIGAAGVCGSDVHMWRGKDPRLSLPLILGHEGIGIIADIKGKKEDILGEGLRIGDLITWDRGVTCGNCYFCTVKKEPSLCLFRQVYGITRNGCYRSHLTLSAPTKVLKIKTQIEPAVLVSASCSGATAAHAVELCRIKEADTVLIQGPGPLGLFSLAFALEQGASKVFVSGTGADKKRLLLAREFGATEIINVEDKSSKEIGEFIKEETNGLGVDTVIDTTGSPQALENGLRLTAAGGTYALPGIATPVGKIPISFYEDVSRKNVRIQGVWVSDTSHFYQAVKIILKNKYPFAKMITHTLPLAEATKALELIEDRQAIKAILIP
ncbi:MAG: zinc-binding dehydrogenase [Candidatus Omnitrophica bacterium]|nr:zinc-binding dehydrogenase [Candidatus Omnitrophota bacterium]